MTKSHEKRTTTVVPPPPQATSIVKKPYENNPFMVPLDGLQMLFARARAIGIALTVLVFIGFLGSAVQSLISFTTQSIEESRSSRTLRTDTPFPIDKKTENRAITLRNEPIEHAKRSMENLKPEQWALIGVVVFIIIIIVIVSWLIGMYINAVVDYASARAAKGHIVTFSDALRGAGQGYLGYLWVNIIVGVKTFLWSLLFIIPGIVMAIRYSLAGLSYFDKQLKGNAAVKDSLALTNGAWLTTYASYGLFNMITLNAATSLVNTGARIRLYQQYDDVRINGQTKPPAHVLSWLTLIIPIALFVMALLFFGAIVLIVVLTKAASHS